MLDPLRTFRSHSIRRLDRHYGLFTGLGLFLLLIICESLPVGRGAFTFTFVLRCICLRISSGLGMPGVGVAPGLNAFFSWAGSGIPGVGVVPLGTLFTASAEGMPGVEFADGGIGLVDRPGGRLLASTLLLTTVTFELVSPGEPHPAIRTTAVNKSAGNETFDIDQKHLVKFKIAVPVRMLRLWRSATAFKPARAGIKRNSEGNVVAIG